MGSTIDEKVVGLKFDNKNFEQNVGTSLGTLGKLKQFLKFDGATKGLTDIDKTAKSIRFDSIADGVQSIASKFTALGVVAFTALSDIASKAISVGASVAKALTIDPVITGFQEYETQMNAIQTILANTASKQTSLKQVNAALNELNTYADKTIYNFTEMTRNIGTFTAAGVDLDTSVSAIKGIANLAAVSGSNSQQASTAMYQLSQALASGTVKLMDWNSVVNAGMGGQVFQDSLKETAKIHGVNVDEMIKKEGSFRDTLQNGWLTSKILTETLAKFTGDVSAEQLKQQGYTEKQINEILELGKMANDAATKVKTFTQLIDTLKEAAQSGWAQSWAIISGDFEEAKAMYTSVSDTLGTLIGNSADARNAMLQSWKDLGGRTAIIDVIKNLFNGAMQVVRLFGDAMHEIIPPMTGQQLADISKRLAELSKGFRLNDADAENLKRTFRGFFAVISIAGQVISALAKGLFGLVGAVAPVGSGFLEVTGSIGDFLVYIDELLKKGRFLEEFMTSLVGVIKTVVSGIAGIDWSKGLGGIAEAFGKMDFSFIGHSFDRIIARFKPLTDAASGFGKVIDRLVMLLGPAFFSIGTFVANTMDKASRAFLDFMSNINFNAISDVFNAGLFAAIGLGLKKFIGVLTSTTKSAGGFIGGFKDILDGITGSLEAMQSSLKAKTLITIATAIGILAASAFVLSTIDSGRLTSALVGITVMLGQLMGSLAVFDMMSKKGIAGISKTAASLIILGIAIGILATSVKTLSSLSWEELAKGLTGVTVLLGALTAASAGMSKVGGNMGKGAIGLILFATAIRILAESVKALGGLDIATLAKGLGGVIVVMATLAGFLKITDFGGFSPMKAAGIVILAAALKILASAVGDFGSLDIGSLAKGIGAIAVVLATLAGFMAITQNASGVIGTATGLVILGAAMKILASAVGDFGGMDLATLAKGIGSMAVSLGIIAGAMAIMPQNMMVNALSLVAVGAALLLISSALKSMGGMSWEEIAKGMVTLAGALLIIAGGLAIMTTALPGAAAVLVAAVALGILVPVLAMAGALSWESIAKGMVMLAGVFVILGAAGYLLAPVSPVILLLAASVALFGVAALAAGVGIGLLAAGLAALAVSGVAGAAALVASVTIILGLIPAIFVALAQAIVAMAGVITEGAPAIVGALVAVLMALIQAVATVAPAILQTLWDLVMLMVGRLVEGIPKMVDAGLRLVTGILRGIASNLGGVISAATDVIVAFINGVTANLPRVIQAGINMIISFIESLARGLRQNQARMEAAGYDLASAIIDGITGGLARGVGAVVSKAKEVAQSAFNAAKDFLQINSPSKRFRKLFQSVPEGAAKGIEDGSSGVSDAISTMAKEAIAGMKLSMQDLASVMSDSDDYTPVISPVLDASQALSQFDAVTTSMSNAKARIGLSYSMANSAASAGIGVTEQIPQTKVEPTQVNYNFQQTNNSPTQLSRKDIYLDTRRLLSSAAT